jgi:hypothetical protein
MLQLRRAVRTARRDPALLLLALRAYLLLVLMRAVIGLLPLRRITSFLGEPMQEAMVDGLSREQLSYAKRVARSIEKVAPITPTTSNCYPQALTARWLLHSRGIPNTLYYGAAFEEGQPAALEAHVWVRCGPHLVTGGSSRTRFQPLTWFADHPSPVRGNRTGTASGQPSSR